MPKVSEASRFLLSSLFLNFFLVACACACPFAWSSQNEITHVQTASAVQPANTKALSEPQASQSSTVKRMPSDNKGRYRGIFDVRVIEPNRAQYILGVKFTAHYNKPVHFLLRPYNGKASIETFLPIYVDNNGEDKRKFKINHKYFVSLRIREDSDTHFSAHISLYKRNSDLLIDINKPYRFSQNDFKEVSSGGLKGELNKVNEYLFVDRDDLKFYFKLNFDILFTEQEIIRRFEDRMQ